MVWFSHLFYFLNQIVDMMTESAGVNEHQRGAQRTYLLTVCLKEGRGLVIRDRCGECQISVYKQHTLKHYTQPPFLITISGFCISACLLKVYPSVGVNTAQQNVLVVQMR